MANAYGIESTALSDISRWYRQRKAAGLSTPSYLMTSALKAQLEVESDASAKAQAREDANELAESNLALGYASLEAQKEAAKASASSGMIGDLGQMGTQLLMTNKDALKNSFGADLFGFGSEEAATAPAVGGTSAPSIAPAVTSPTEATGGEIASSAFGPPGSLDVASYSGSMTDVGGGVLPSSGSGGGAAMQVGTQGAQAALSSTSAHTAVALPANAPAGATGAALPAGGSLGGVQAAEVGFNSATMGVVGGAGIGAGIGGLLGNAIGGKAGGIAGSTVGGAVGGFIVGMQAGSVGGPAGAVIGGVVGLIGGVVGGGK